MARTSNTDERRRQIAAGLLTVMARQGYDGASTADIARAAGLAPGLVHYHFENKQAILLAALELLVRDHADRLAAALATAAADPAAELAVFIDVHLGLGAHADPAALACWVLFAGEALRQRPVGARFEAALVAVARTLADVIRRGAARGVFTCAEPDAAAAALVAAIQGYFVVAAAARAVIPHGSAAACVHRMAAGLLAPAAPARRRRS
jgi:TetR/AcrR family transcriptional repressor of bet genes